MRFRSKTSFVLILALLTASDAWAERKVAIIVDGNDNFGGLADSFHQNADAAEKEYKSRGFEVIRVEAAKGATALDFRKSLAGLEGVGELTVNFFTHGSVRNLDESFGDSKPLPESLQRRFPLSYLRQDEVQTQVGDNSDPLKGPIRFGFAMIRPGGTYNTDFIGLGDLHDSLANMKRKNPKLHTTIISLACFGSNATRGLQDIPDLQVFSGSSASQTADITSSSSALQQQAKENSEDGAWSLKDCYDLSCETLKHQSAFVPYFLEQLGKGESYLQAFNTARTTYLSQKLKQLDIRAAPPGIDLLRGELVRPQSSLELLFADQCLGAPPRTEVVSYCQLAPDINDTKIFFSSTTRQLIQFDLKNELKKDYQYVNTIKTLIGCNPKQRQSEQNLMKSALMQAQKYLLSKYKSLSIAEINEAEAKLKKLRHDIIAATTPGQLLQIVPNTKAFGVVIDDLKTNNAADIDLETEKQIALVFIATDLDHLSDPKFLNYYKQRAISALSTEKPDSPLSLCLQTPLTCNMFKAFPHSYTEDLDSMPLQSFQLTDKAEMGRAVLLVLNKCSSSDLLNLARTALQGRARQLECIARNTTNDPLLRAFALSMIVTPPNSDDTAKSCGLFDLESARNDRLRACLSQPNQFGDEAFWEQMSSLYLQGQSALR